MMYYVLVFLAGALVGGILEKISRRVFRDHDMYELRRHPEGANLYELNGKLYSLVEVKD